MTPLRNQWQTHKSPCAEWYATLPPTLLQTPEAFFELVDLVAEVGAREEVYQILEARPSRARPAFLATPSEDWGAFVRRHWSPDTSSLFPDGGPCRVNEYAQRTRARLAVFDDTGAIVEQDVEDLGELFKSVRPDYGGRILHDCPVRISDWVRAPAGPPMSWASIKLESDIWFPWVVGVDDRDDDADEHEWIDNRALAARHTPRCNRFLAAVRDKFLALGGTWEISDEGDMRKRYAHWIAEDGIRLDTLPAEKWR